MATVLLDHGCLYSRSKDYGVGAGMPQTKQVILDTEERRKRGTSKSVIVAAEFIPASAQSLQAIFVVKYIHNIPPTWK